MNDEFWNEGNLMALGAREIVKRHAAEVAELKAERDAVKLQYNPDDVAFTSRVPALESEIAALRAELIQSDIEIRDRAWYVTEYAIVCKERDGLRAELADVRELRDKFLRELSARTAQLIERDEELAAVKAERDSQQKVIETYTQSWNKIHESLGVETDHSVWKKIADINSELTALRQPGVRVPVTGYDFTEYELDSWMQKELNWSTTPEKAVKIMNYMAAHALATIAVPPGIGDPGPLVLVPNEPIATPETLEALFDILKTVPALHHQSKLMNLQLAKKLLAALRPWMHTPVGWTLDVTAEELRNKLWGFFDADKLSKEVLDLCRSRIRPVYECKECARRRNVIPQIIADVTAAADAARAALEGE